MRVQIVADIDGTDEQQLKMLETLEEYAESGAILGLYDRDEQLDLDMVYVSVTEIPERQVRGRQSRKPKVGDLAWHKDGWDPRPVAGVFEDMISLRIFNERTSWIPAKDYTFTRPDQG